MTAVAVTGLGAVSPFGLGVKALWEGVRSGTCAIRPATTIDTEGLRSHLAAEVPEPLPGSRRRSRGDRLAMAAAQEALDDAALLTSADRRDLALVVGAVGGGMFEAEAWYARRRQAAAVADLSPLRSMLPFSHAEMLAARLGIRGPRQTVVAACSSGAAALATAADLIRDGVVDAALAGGVDAMTRLCYLGFNALRLVDPRPCRPFDRDRRGMSIGEGAAFIVLESAARARERGVRIHAVLAGAGATTDAYHVTSPDPSGDGMARAMRTALAAARLDPRDIGYVNAHGTGTVQNDRTEARALRAVFGEGGVLVSSTKSMIGHTMAAAGSLEAVVTVLALESELVPPTANLVETDPEVAFDCVPRAGREVAVGAALSNSFGFGGQNVTLVFARP